ncbi:VOC family protein [Nocardioides humilatus]|uniref:VOC family protein n=1 Tax=Nocardioides humilatus TaxID=2607660 RepID=A0A5B1LGT4_9ACTN|nr:VOC family protein [Nocardioides humilatus]KAA1419010.1 VOC family protein [Nocardioides humilatus]
MAVTIAELFVADPPEAWEAAGFAVDADGTCRIGSVAVRLLGRDHDLGGKGIVGWTLRGTGSIEADLDGIPTTVTDAPQGTPATHPNGVTIIDHVVLLSPDLGRTVASLGTIGLEPRKMRDGELGAAAVRQVFYRLGEVILEVVGSPDTASDGPSTLWGLTHVAGDIDAAVALLGDNGGRVKEAVQPGRRITTLRTRELGMSVRTALISPHVPRSR